MLVAIATSTQQLKSQADLNLREIVSAEDQGDVYRALLGYEDGYPYMTIEVIELSGDGPHRLVGLWELSGIDGGKRFSELQEGMSFARLRWVGRELQFVYTKGSVKQNCVVSQVSQLRPHVDCR